MFVASCSPPCMLLCYSLRMQFHPGIRKLLRENLYSLAFFQVLHIEYATARAALDGAQQIFECAVAQLWDQARAQAQADANEAERNSSTHLHSLLFRIKAAHANAQCAASDPQAVNGTFALAFSFGFGLRQRVEQL